MSNWDSIRQFFSSIDWTKIGPLLGIVGSFVVFIWWERRKKSLEIEKLRVEIDRLKTLEAEKLQLEVEKLKKEELRIYRPTFEEINKIIQKHQGHSGMLDGFYAGRGSSRKIIMFASVGASALTDWLRWFADNEIHTFGNTSLGISSGGSEDLSRALPDPLPIYELWTEVRDEAAKKLPKKDVQRMDIAFGRLVILSRTRLTKAN